MLSENTQYEMTTPLKLKLVDGSEKEVLSKTYMSRELNVFVEGKHIVSDLDNDPQIIKTNELAKVTNMSLNLDEIDNSDNLHYHIYFCQNWTTFIRIVQNSIGLHHFNLGTIRIASDTFS